MSQLFINPVELLELGTTPVAELDGAKLRSARQRLRHRLQLEDSGTIDYHGQQLDQSAVEMACADLDDPDRLWAWHRLAGWPALGDFLGTGRLEPLVTNRNQYAKVAADQDVIELIGPRFAVPYDQAISQAFEVRDAALLGKLAQLPKLFKPTQQAQATRRVGRALGEATDAVARQTEQLDENDNVARVVATLRLKLTKAGWTAILVALPDLLAGPRTALVQAVRNYAIALFNTVDDSTVAALQLLREATAVPADARLLDQMREDIRQIEEIATQRQQRMRQEAAASRFNQAIEQGMAYQKQADAGTVAMTTLTQWSAGLTPLITELNAETAADAAEARDFLAVVLRGLCINIWNKNQRNGQAALTLLAQGLTIRAQAGTRTILLNDQQKLKRMVEENNRPVLPPSPPIRPSSGIPGWVWLLVVLGIIIFLVNSCNSGDSTTTTGTPATEIVPVEPTGTLVESPEPEIPTPAVAPSTDASLATIPPATYEPPVSTYAGNHLANGASPLNNCFGKGRYGGPCWIKFDNSANDTDAIMCLVSTRTGRTIRNEYIRAGTVFKMSRVPRGSYYIKGFYGNDWNPTRTSACGTAGYFDSNQNFSASPDNVVEMVSNAGGFSTNTITLYGVANGNMAQQPLSAEQFFQQ